MDVWGGWGWQLEFDAAPGAADLTASCELATAATTTATTATAAAAAAANVGERCGVAGHVFARLVFVKAGQGGEGPHGSALRGVQAPVLARRLDRH